jgi:hypothetical protein
VDWAIQTPRVLGPSIIWLFWQSNIPCRQPEVSEQHIASIITVKVPPSHKELDPSGSVSYEIHMQRELASELSNALLSSPTKTLITWPDTQNFQLSLASSPLLQIFTAFNGRGHSYWLVWHTCSASCGVCQHCWLCDTSHRTWWAKPLNVILAGRNTRP